VASCWTSGALISVFIVVVHQVKFWKNLVGAVLPAYVRFCWSKTTGRSFSVPQQTAGQISLLGFSIALLSWQLSAKLCLSFPLNANFPIPSSPAAIFEFLSQVLSCLPECPVNSNPKPSSDLFLSRLIIGFPSPTSPHSSQI
jgi:hypothetical protein